MLAPIDATQRGRSSFGSPRAPRASPEMSDVDLVSSPRRPNLLLVIPRGRSLEGEGGDDGSGEGRGADEVMTSHSDDQLTDDDEDSSCDSSSEDDDDVVDVQTKRKSKCCKLK